MFGRRRSEQHRFVNALEDWMVADGPLHRRLAGW
jgi:hypothetical protein